MAGLDVFDDFIKDYFRARPWMLESDGSAKISSLDMDPDNPAEWGGAAMTYDDKGPKTPAGYFKNGRAWLVEAEDNLVEGQDSATLAMLAIASALLALCAQFIKEQGDD
jgi:hypothetical protein